MGSRSWTSTSPGGCASVRGFAQYLQQGELVTPVYLRLQFLTGYGAGIRHEARF